MSTLIQKAQHILDEKNSKIIPTNIKDGVQIFDIEGTYEGIDTSDATATVNDIVKDTTAYVNGVKLEGALAERRGQHARVGLDKGYNLTRNDNDGFIKFDIHKFESAGSIPDEMAIDNDTTFSGDLDYSDIVTVSGLRANIIKKNETILGVTGTLETSGTDTSDATATENDLVADTTAYVNGVKITGKLFDNRNSSGYNEIDGTEIRDFTDAGYLYSGGYIKKLPSYLSGVVFSDEVLIKVKTPYSTITGEIGLTSDKLKKGVTILGVTGTLDAQGTDTSDATATVNDLIQNTTAYVNGAKLSGTIKDERSNHVDINVGNIDVDDGTVLSVDCGIDSSSTYSAIAINERSHLDALINLTEPTITNGIGLVPNKIKIGETILGVTGTYTGGSSISNNDIMFVEPGNVICLDLHLLSGMLSQALDEETKNLLVAYDTDTLDNYTIKFCDCVDMGNPYNHSGIGLVVSNKSAYIKGYNWDLTTGQNVNAFSKFVDLVSQSWPDADSVYVYDLISNLDYLEDYHDEIEIEYPANLPTMLLLENYQVQIFINRGNNVVEPISVTVPSSFIRITTGC